ncbi:MAG: MnmC family methyltransferase [Vampirovibrionales bacterium]
MLSDAGRGPSISSRSPNRGVFTVSPGNRDARQLIQYIQDIAIDLVYHDAFSAKVQPELWTQQLFEQYYRLCQPAEGAVLTYGGAASVRKGLANAGFVVGSLVSICRQSGYLRHVQPLG